RLGPAVYRLSTPIDIWQLAEEDGDEVPALVKGLMNPMRATVRAVTVEYGLEGSRFWLPRMQAVDVDVQAGFIRAPMRFEQSFRYAAVNGLVEVPEPSPDAVADSAGMRVAISIGGGDDERTRAERDSIRLARDSVAAARVAAREAECSASGSWTRTTTRLDGTVPVTVRVPCDTVALANSSALPGSFYDDNEQLFGDDQREALIREALALGAQAGWSPQLPTVRWGIGDGMLRYNRVEGLSPAVRVDQQLGNGYALSALARV